VLTNGLFFVGPSNQGPFARRDAEHLFEEALTMEQARMDVNQSTIADIQACLAKVSPNPEAATGRDPKADPNDPSLQP
jgi:hypothetical protein